MSRERDGDGKRPSIGFHNQCSFPQIVTLRQLATIYGVDYRSVQRWIHDGWLNGKSGLLRLPHLWRVDLDEFRAHFRAPSAEPDPTPRLVRRKPNLHLVRNPGKES